jgi:hypothetical protein
MKMEFDSSPVYHERNLLSIYFFFEKEKKKVSSLCKLDTFGNPIFQTDGAKAPNPNASSCDDETVLSPRHWER